MWSVNTLSNPFFYYQKLEKHVSGTRNGFSSIYVIVKNLICFYDCKFYIILCNFILERKNPHVAMCTARWKGILCILYECESEKPLVGHQSWSCVHSEYHLINSQIGTHKLVWTVRLLLSTPCLNTSSNVNINHHDAKVSEDWRLFR